MSVFEAYDNVKYEPHCWKVVFFKLKEPAQEVSLQAKIRNASEKTGINVTKTAFYDYYLIM